MKDDREICLEAGPAAGLWLEVQRLLDMLPAG
jgi:hypothetical protein